MAMDVSSTVNMALGLQQAAVSENVGTIMLRKTLDLASQEMSTLMQSAMPQLASSGTLGTNINTYA